jgi:hypothetical protein
VFHSFLNVFVFEKETAMRSKGLSPVLGVLLVGLAANASAQQTTLHSPKNPNVTRQAQQTKARPAVPNFGTSTTVYQRIPASAFIVDTVDSTGNNTPFSSQWSPAINVYEYVRFAEDPSGFNHFIASPILPGGALLTYVELDSCDSNGSGNHVTLDVYDCDFIGNCVSPPMLSLSSVNNAFPPCSYATGSMSYAVDNFERQILLDVHLPSGDTTNSLAGVIVGFTLQVSPAPSTATFNDVPTSDPGFQYVEALVASGITAGCGGGNYCPDNPLTRRQMAVFLAKALGLNWSR